MTEPADSNLCAFDGRPYESQCTRPKKHDRYCIFHTALTGWLSQEEVQTALNELIAHGDGNWCGFKLPFDITLSEQVFDFDLDARGMVTSGLKIEKCIFKGLVFLNGSTFKGDVEISGGEFVLETSINDATFERQFVWAITSRRVVAFSDARFKGPARFEGEFASHVFFSRAVFEDAVEFVGAWDPVAIPGGTPAFSSKARYIFNDEVSLEGVDFQRPSRTSFRMVDLRRANITQVDLRGVRFDDVKWYQNTLGRRGINDEVWAKESNFLTTFSPRLEAAYRNLRAAHEDSKDFQSATDFYIGELEARRRQRSRFWRIFGIESIYKLLSNYGASPVRAVMWLFTLVILHMIASTAVRELPCIERPWACEFDVETVVNSAQLLTVLRVPDFRMLPDLWGLVDVAFQVAIVVQLALVIFALRARIRRG